MTLKGSNMNNPSPDSYRDNLGTQTKYRKKAHPVKTIEKLEQPCASRLKQD
jgi:hypothetical protein